MEEPSSLAFVLDIISTCATDAMLARASPLNPSVPMLSKSSTFLILLVACGIKASLISSFSIPEPLSKIEIDFIPPSSISITILSAPASMLFSISSLTTDAGFSTTSPADILLLTILSKILILLINLSFCFCY